MRYVRGAAIWRLGLCAAFLAVQLSLDACRTHSAHIAPPAGAARGPAQTPTPAAATRYTIDAGRSQVLVLVYRDGPMGHLGHNHVIAVRELTGSVVMPQDQMQSAFQFEFPVESMSVDEPQLRAQQGTDFESTLDEAAIAGTRDHMLGAALLDSKQYPRISLQSEQIGSGADGLIARTRIAVRDTTALVTIPLAIQRTEVEMTVSGEFDLTHTQLGLTPYSVALGALRVAQRMHVRYRLVATRDH
jgi:polyisoprenoid-binding protein YceI